MCQTVKCAGCGKSMASCSLVNGKCWKCRQTPPSPPVQHNHVTPPNTSNNVYHTH